MFYFNSKVSREKLKKRFIVYTKTLPLNQKFLSFFAFTKCVFPFVSQEEEEFFECNEDAESGAEGSSKTSEDEHKTKYLLWDKPVGRLTKHPTLRLVKTGDVLYLPITQEPVPKTEDQIEEDAQIMIQLGTDKYASEMRVRLMSASLLSDMESFKVLQLPKFRFFLIPKRCNLT